ncbi:MAG: hypothetical protein N2318_04825 [Meiothermus sp.]|nr:hypothetical protein [Meiothermus sp.]
MPLFGNFKYIPFTELIPPLVKRTGGLVVQMPSAAIALEVNQGALVRAYRNRELLSLEQAKEILLDLVLVPEAAFEFTGRPIQARTGDLNYFLPNMLVDLVAFTNARPTYADQFIDPTTRFCRTEKNGYPPGIPGRFLIEASYWLESPKGASSHELSSHLRVSLETVLYNLYSLRQSGYVQALDAFRLQQLGQPQGKPRPGLWSRLARGLRGGPGL